jgi:hypothetical protein
MANFQQPNTYTTPISSSAARGKVFERLPARIAAAHATSAIAVTSGQASPCHTSSSNPAP